MPHCASRSRSRSVSMSAGSRCSTAWAVASLPRCRSMSSRSLRSICMTDLRSLSHEASAPPRFMGRGQALGRLRDHIGAQKCRADAVRSEGQFDTRQPNHGCRPSATTCPSSRAWHLPNEVAHHPRPPGASTRTISRATSARSVTWRSTDVHSSAVKTSSANGSLSALATTNSARRTPSPAAKPAPPSWDMRRSQYSPLPRPPT